MNEDVEEDVEPASDDECVYEMILKYLTDTA